MSATNDTTNDTANDTTNHTMNDAASAVPHQQPLACVKRNEILTFRLGRYNLKRLSVRALSLDTPGTRLSADLSATLANLPSIPADCEAVVLPDHPIQGDVFRLRNFWGPVMYYVSNSGPRYLVDLRGTFQEYASKFSGMRRHSLNRMARRLADRSGGTLELKLYSRPEEMAEFHRIAVAISHKTYKASLGATFDEPAGELAQAAARDAARGYVLYFAGAPIAYEFFRVSGRNLLGAHTSYDPEHARSSPGTMLLWLVLQSLFAEQKYEYLDFLWGRHAFKERFATTTITVATVFCFRNTLRNKLVVLLHYLSIVSSRCIGAITRMLKR